MDTHGSWQTNTANWVLAWARGRNYQKQLTTNGEGLSWLGARPDYLGPSLGVSDDIEAAGREGYSEATEARIRGALHKIPPDCTYGEWLEAGMALHGLRWTVCVETGGITKDRGFDLWNEWSSGALQGKNAKKYRGREALERKWASFRGDYKGRKVTVRYIYHRAREYGWDGECVPPPSGSPCDHRTEAGQQARQTQGPHDHGSQQEQKNRTNHQEQDSQTGREQNGRAQFRKKVSATPFEAFDFAKIPPRQWLYGRHYVRKYVTATVAPGGGAKTAEKIIEAVSMAVGRDFLDDSKPIERLHVWYWNGEDPLDEIGRRIAAVCVHYEIDPKELEG
jgi:hypothetical protein